MKALYAFLSLDTLKTVSLPFFIFGGGNPGKGQGGPKTYSELEPLKLYSIPPSKSIGQAENQTAKTLQA